MKVDIWPYQVDEKAKGAGTGFEVAATIARRIDGPSGPGYVFAEDPTPVTLKDGRTVTGQTWWQGGRWNDQAGKRDPFDGPKYDPGTVVGVRLNAREQYRDVRLISPLDPNKSDNWPRPPEGYEIRYNEAGQLVITEGGPAAIRQPQQAATGPPAASAPVSGDLRDPTRASIEKQVFFKDLRPDMLDRLPDKQAWALLMGWYFTACELMSEGAQDVVEATVAEEPGHDQAEQDASAAAAVYAAEDAAADAAVEANAEAAGWG